MSKYRVVAVIVAVMLVIGILTYSYMYYNQHTSDAKAQPQLQPSTIVGIIDLQKVSDAHPRIKELDTLKSECAALTEEIQAKQQVAGRTIDVNEMNLSQNAMQGLNQALQQEFTAKMTAKQSEIHAKGQKKYEDIRREMEVQMAAYVKEQNAQYQNSLFNINLKRNTVSLTQEQKDELDKQRNKLEAERNSKFEARKNELTAINEKRLKAMQAEDNNEFEAYKAQVAAELNQKGDAKRTELTSRDQSLLKLAPAKQSELNKLSSELEAKNKAISILYETIVNDIRDKTAKVASAQGIEAVITNYKTNVKAVDITAAVVAEFKK